MKLHENIRNYRKFRGITQQQLADALGRTKAVISTWENGLHSPDLESCEKMCRIFSVSPNELFGWEENQEYIEWLENTKQLKKELDNMKKERAAMDQRIMEYTKRLAEFSKEGV